MPLRTSFACGAPDHDPVRWSTEAALRRRATAWSGSARFGTQPLPAVGGAPTIALVRPGHAAAGAAVEVVIPVGTPGVDHAGSVYRTDGVVALPVRALRDAGLPGAAAGPRRRSATVSQQRRRRMTTTRLAGGRVYDPLNGIDGKVMDLWIRGRPDRRRARRRPAPTR